jgi:hypothetical protein
MPSGEPHRSAAHSANHVAAPIDEMHAVAAYYGVQSTTRTRQR